MKKALLIAFLLLPALSGIKGQSLSISPNTLFLSPLNNSSDAFTITSSDVVWSIADNSGGWLSFSALSGDTNAAVTVTAAENASPSSRSADVTISGTGGVTPQVLVVTQNGGSLTISHSEVTVGASANSDGTFSITSNTSWTVSDNAGWLTLSAINGSSDAEIIISVESNLLTTVRTAEITITGNGLAPQIITVTQEGSAASLSVTPSTLTVPATSNSSGSFSITSNSSWSVSEESTWLSASPADGSGNKDITISADANSSTSTRSAVISITAAGVATPATVTVTQEGIASYSVTVSANPSGGGTITGAGPYPSGATVTLTASPAAGYSFVNWSEDGSPVFTNSTYTFDIISDRTLVANFSILSYSITTSSQPSAGGSTSGGGSFNYGESATVTATPAAGYQFINWTVGGSVVSASSSYTFPVTSNRSLVANFSTLSYTISTSTNPAGIGSTTGSGTYNFGTSATVTAAAATGYRFVNWTEGGTVVSANSTYTFTVNSNRSLVANYTINNYTISTSSSPTGGGSTNGAGTYTHGSQATVTATPSAGYAFSNWTEAGSTVSANVSYSFTVTGNRTLVANFNLITYTVSTSSSPSAGGTTSGGGSFSPGATVTVTASPSEDFQFAGWTEGGTTVSTNRTYSFVISSNRNLVATFQSITYLTVNTLSSPPAGGTTSGSGTHPAGTTVTVRATEATGYNFESWKEGENIVSSSESYTFTLNSNRTLVANFSPVRYTISASSLPTGGGTTSGGGIYTYGDDVTVTAHPSSGYQFVNWTQGGTTVSTNSNYTFTVTENRNLTANFSQITYTVALSSAPATGGTTNGGGTYGSGSTATVTATPATGYRFVNWTQGGTSVSANPVYSFTVTANISLVANFTVANYTITTAAIPAGTGTVSGGGSFNYGTSVTVRATPASGYQFTNWTEGGSSVSTNASYTFTVNGNRNLIANFSQIPRILTLTGPSGTPLVNNDVITLDYPDAGSMVITVNANAEWKVSENSLWLNAIKESNTRLRVNYLENISVVEKKAPLIVSTALNASMQIIIKQEARVSQLSLSKAESVTLYPNPAEDRTILRFEEEFKGKILIFITTIQGIPVMTSEYENIQEKQNLEIQLTGIPSGHYLLHISGETDQKIFRLIKL